MKRNRIKRQIFYMMTLKSKLILKHRNFLFTFMIFFLLFLSLLTFQGTIGKFLQAFTVNDSAVAAKFDIVITAPDEFGTEQDENLFEYHFLSDIDIRGFNFQVENKGEADVLCQPHISNDIVYRIYVSEEECTKFAVDAKETVNFWLFISPDGLDTNIKDADFFVDIQQIEGV